MSDNQVDHPADITDTSRHTQREIMAPSAVWVVRKQTRHESPQRGFWRPLRCPIDRSRPARTHGLRALQSWVLTGVVVQHLTVARIAQALGMSWNTAHTAVLGEGQRLLINDPTRFDGVRVIGVDEHVWRHISYGDMNRHRYLGRDAHPRSQRPLPALGHGPRPLQAGLQNLAGLPARHVA